MQTANWQTTHGATSGGIDRRVAAVALGIALTLALVVGLATAGIIPAPGTSSAPEAAPAPRLTAPALIDRAGERAVGGGLTQSGKGEQPVGGRSLDQGAPSVVHGDARAMPE